MLQDFSINQPLKSVATASLAFVALFSPPLLSLIVNVTLCTAVPIEPGCLDATTVFEVPFDKVPTVEA